MIPNLPDFRYFSVAAVLLVIAGLLGQAFAQSANASPFGEPVKNVILVHGAWAEGADSWSKVIPLLEAKGLNVVAVHLPLTSMADDVASVKRAIALEDGPILLVGHSYGGSVITEAGNDPEVVGLVYVAAFAPDVGQSVTSLSATVAAPPLAAQVRPDAFGFLKITKTGIYDDFAQELPSAEKAILFAAQVPTNVNSLGGKISAAAGAASPHGTSSPETTVRFRQR